MYHLVNNRLILLITIIFSLNSFSDGRQIFEKAKSGVVYVVTDKGTGSGVLISQQGYILTNWHVVEGAELSSIKIAFHPVYYSSDVEDYFFEVEVIKTNKVNDLALLKINNPPKDIKVINISSIIPATGSEVHAIGHPHDEFWTYTKGYISQHRRDYSWQYNKEGGAHEANVYQMQTPIGEGSSGGPLLNQYGNLIGINTFGSKENQSLNYAVDVSEIIDFLANT